MSENSYENVIGPEEQWNTFKWEDFSTLEHACGVCGVRLTGANAKTSCFGKHIEACPLYHPMMQRVNRAHACRRQGALLYPHNVVDLSLTKGLTWNSCHHSHETHHERDRAIAELCFEILDQFKAQSPNTTPRPRKKKRHTSSSSISTTDDGSSVTDELAVEAFDVEHAVAGNGSEVIATDKLTKRQKKEHKRMMKELERKAGGLRLDTSTKTGIISKPRIATQSDIDDLSLVLHGPEFLAQMCGKSGAAQTANKGRALQEDVQARNRGPTGRPANSHIFLWSAFDHNPDPAQAHTITQRVLEKVGVNPDAIESCKSMKPSLEKLQRLVEEDLIALQNELRDVRKREKIYWGFVGRDAWKAHWQRVEERDWHTGARIAQ